MQTNEIQELLLDTIPAWHYWFARPFKRMLNDGVSLDMYYCIQSMRRSGRTMTMTELANFARMPKQQMSRLVDKLVEGGFAERLSDPDDRRVIRLRATEKADEYVASFLEKDAAEFRAFFDQLEGEEREIDVRCIYNYSLNMLSRTEDQIKGIEAYRKMDFVVTHALTFNPNAQYSDIVLPVCSPWERG